MANQTIVQAISHTWHKKDRGGIEAQKRAQSPKAYILTKNIAKLGDAIVHSVHNEEEYVSENVLTYENGSNNLLVSRFRIKKFDEKLEIYNLRIYKDDGEPKLLISLKRNEYIKILTNFRGCYGPLDEGSTWFYSSMILNIGNFSNYSDSVFLTQQPFKVFDFRVDLYRRGRA